MDRPDSARTTRRASARRPGIAPGRPPRRPAALPPGPGRQDEAPAGPPGPPGLSISVLVRGLPATVGAVGLVFFVVQAAFGWGLGIAGAGLTVLVAVMLLAMLVVTDALGGRREAREDDDEPYDLAVCGAVAAAVAVAIACLYLPLPWGGLCAAVVLAGLVVTLHLR